VIIIYTDDHGTLDVGCFGAEDLHTPHLDRLAAEGIRFTRAYAHTFCCPSRAALLTGRHPQRGGVNQWTQGDMKDPEQGVNMRLEELTLAEVLGGAGYRTALFGKWHLGAHRDYGPPKQGFDELFGHRGGFIDNHIHYFLQGDGYHDLYEGTEEVWAKGQYFPGMITERAVRFIEKNRERPFFLYLAFNTPHYPEQPLPEHLARYESLEDPRRTYAAFLTTTDHYIGKVLATLDDHGLRDDTIVIMMGDNGHQSYESFDFFQIKVDDHASGLPKGHRFSVGDGPNPGGGYTGKWIGQKGEYFEGGIRVPAILSYPAKLPRGAVRSQVVTAMDWFPTVLELCGVEPPPVTIDGRSVLEVVRSAAAPSPHPVLYFQWQNMWAVCEGDWKLIRLKANREEARERFSLHNLGDAEPEVKDHLAEQPEVAERLRGLHRAWEQDVFAGQKR
jgi:arylsulfatase A-like enzyme